MVNTWKRHLAWCFSHTTENEGGCCVSSRRGNNLGTSGLCEGRVWLSLPRDRDGDGDLAPPGAGGDGGSAAAAIGKGALIK